MLRGCKERFLFFS